MRWLIEQTLVKVLISRVEVFYVLRTTEKCYTAVQCGIEEKKICDKVQLRLAEEATE